MLQISQTNNLKNADDCLGNHPHTTLGVMVMLKILKKKSKGVSDLVMSIIAITGLVTVSLIMISLMADVYTRTQLDQVARKYILQLEAYKVKDVSEYDAIEALIREDLWEIPAVSDTAAFGKTQDSIVVNITYEGTKPKYGDRIGLELKVPVTRTNFFYFVSNDSAELVNKVEDKGSEGSEVNGPFGRIRRNVYSIATVRKQTTVKY